MRRLHMIAVLLCIAVVFLLPYYCSAGRSSGGSRSSGSRSSSSRSSSSSWSSWGSSSRSGSGSSWGSSRGSSGSSLGSRWGSSSSSGSRSSWGSSSGRGNSGSSWGRSRPTSRFASGGSYGGNPLYSAGSSFRAPSKTLHRISAPSTGVARSSHPRPQANIPRSSASYSYTPTHVIYAPVYNNYRGSSGIGVNHVIGAYYLSRMMRTRPYYGYGYGYYGYGYGGYYGPSPYETYVPYRDRYEEYFTTTTTRAPPTTSSYRDFLRNFQNDYSRGHGFDLAELQYSVAVMESGTTTARTTTTTTPTTTPEPQSADLCTLARWNRELPYSELPNIALDFLANDTISGGNTGNKSRFIYELFTESILGLDSYNSSADVFTIPESRDLAVCNFLTTKEINISQAKNSSDPEEPIVTSARNILQLYSNLSQDLQLLEDLVAAAKACLPPPRGQYIPYKEVIPCLGFSFTPEYLTQLRLQSSVFGNSEICSGQLSPDLFKCTPSDDDARCKFDHVVALNLFARNYYLCSEAIESDTMYKIREAYTDAKEQSEYDGYWYGASSRTTLHTFGFAVMVTFSVAWSRLGSSSLR